MTDFKIFTNATDAEEKELMRDFVYNQMTRAITISPKKQDVENLCKSVFYHLSNYKYFLVLEYQPKTERPHFHGVIKCHPKNIHNLKKFIDDNIGFSKIDLRLTKKWYEYMFKNVEETETKGEILGRPIMTPKKSIVIVPKKFHAEKTFSEKIIEKFEDNCENNFHISPQLTNFEGSPPRKNPDEIMTRGSPQDVRAESLPRAPNSEEIENPKDNLVNDLSELELEFYIKNY